MARPKKQPQELLLPEPRVDHDDLIAQQLADYIRQMVPTDSLNELVTNAEGEFPQYRNDPNGFAKDILGINPTDQQETIANSVLQNRFTTVEAGHSLGKSTTAAILALWWVSTRNPATLLSSAPSFHQVNGILWRNMRQYKERARAQLPGVIFQTPRWEIAPHRFGVGVSPRKATDVDVATMQGYHSPNLLVILDEAGGLTLPLWNVSMSLVTGEFNRFLAIGNPVARSGPFYDSTQQSSFHSIRISCLDHPNVLTGTEIVPGAVSRQWVEERINDWCHPTNNPTERSFQWKGKWYDPLPVFEARVLGRPPVEAEDQLIPFLWASSAQRPVTEGISGERVLGLDVARHGSAASALIYRVGDHVLWVKRQRGNDTTTTSDWLMAEIKENEADVAYIDEVGVGGGVCDQCTRAGAPVQGVNVQRQAMQKTRFSNMRHELWWTVREKLRTGEMTLPFDDDLIADLTCIKYSFDPLGRIQVEEKEQTIKRLGRSPDAGDALALSYMGNVPGSTRESLEYATISTDPAAWFHQGSRWSVSSGRQKRSWKIR